jgi:hypothetical protein
MVNIREINDQETVGNINDHRLKGGALRIAVFSISENYLGELPDAYKAHLITARQTLEKENHALHLHLNAIAEPGQRSGLGFHETDYDKLDNSGIQIDLKHFLGPHFDLEKHKPLMRGQLGNATLNSYFYYDQQEIPENSVNLQRQINAYQRAYPENKGNFVSVCMEPPYNLSLAKAIKKRGEYLLDFMDYFFGELSEIEVYAWDTTCAPLFEVGREWWGSYFWTVYNPSKQWYVGIIAAETD